MLPENFMIQQPYRVDYQLLFGKEALTRERGGNRLAWNVGDDWHFRLEIDPNIIETLLSVLGKKQPLFNIYTGKLSIFKAIYWKFSS